MEELGLRSDLAGSSSPGSGSDPASFQEFSDG